MKKFVRLLVICMLLTGVSACSNGSEPSSESGPPAEITQQLQLAFSDFQSYYINFFDIATATSEEEFGLSELVLISRVDEADTREILRETATTDNLELAELSGDLVAVYEEIHANWSAATQQEYIDFCDRMYLVIERLSVYIDEPLLENIVPVTTQMPDSDPSPVTDTEDSGSTETIPNSRWDSDDGYSLIFSNGRVFLGVTFEDDAFIISNGSTATYVISGNTIAFQAVGDPRSATFSYNGSEMIDTNGQMFDVGSRFTKNYNLP